MQQAGDANLALAVKEGQKRYLGVKLMIDWARDGNYADALSDMSAYVDEWTVERSLAGTVPAELETTEGYSTAKLTLKISGKIADGTPLWKVFSPYSGGTYGTGGAVNTPMYIQAVVRSPLGVWNIDQFTGWVDSAVPDLASGTVTMIAFDGGGQLEAGITVPRWGADAWRRESIVGDTAANTDEASESCTIEAGWLIDSALRRAGFFEGPQWHNNATWAATVRGSVLPEVGNWSQITEWNWGNTWPFGMKKSTPHVGPAMQTPGEVWSKAASAAKYGVGYKGSLNLGNWKATGNRGIKTMTCGSQARAWSSVSTFGGNNSNLIGFAGWIYIDTTTATDPWSSLGYYLSAYHQNFSGSDQYPANIFVTVKHKTQVVKIEVNNEGATKNWSWTTPSLGSGWHYYSAVIQFRSTGVFGSVWVDGFQYFNATNGGLASALGALSYSWIEGTTNTVYADVQGPLQFIQWIQNDDLPIASYVQPPSTPPTAPRAQAKVDLSAQRLLWFPDINNTPAGDVIQALTNAELGAFYFTEQGVATWDSRATIKSRQLAVNSVFDVTIDNASNLTPESAYVSVANKIGYTARVRLGVPYQNIYASQKADQWVIQPGAHPRYPVTLADVQSFFNGSIPPQTFSQGYDPGLSPPTQYWQNYMAYYKPEYYQNGCALYQPNSRSGSGPPTPQSNAYVYALPGYANGDLDNRHMRLAFGNDNGSTVIEFAVDDSTPFLRVGGTLLMDRPTLIETVSDATSIARYRERVYNLPADDWHQDILWLRTLGASLLADTKNPTTQFQDIEVVGDPRRQLQDVCRVVHQDAPGGQPGMTGSTVAYGSVVGIKRSYVRSGDGGALTDVLTIRTFAP